jgi:hypothetical protein
MIKSLCVLVCETSSELETCDLVYPIICRCRKHRHLARQEGWFVAWFPPNVLMVHSLKPVIIIDGNHQTGVRFALCKTIRFGSLEFMAKRFSSLSLSPKGSDSGTVFIGMDDSGSLSLHTILKESINEDDMTSYGGGKLGPPYPSRV